jgi:transposase
MADRGKTACGEHKYTGGTMVRDRQAAIVGVDTGEEDHSFALLDDQGELDRCFRLENNEDDVRRTFNILRSLREGRKLAVVVDSSRSLNAVVVRVAMGIGAEVWRVNPKAAHEFRCVEGQPRKDDDKDAFIHARMLYVGAKACRLVAAPQPEESALMRLTRLHTTLTDERTAALNRLRSALLEVCPEILRRSWDGPRWRSRGLFAVLERWPALLGLAEESAEVIEEVLRTAGGARDVLCEAHALHKAARTISLPAEEHKIVALETQLFATQYREANESLGDVDRCIAERVGAHAIGKKLLEMPGIGPFVAGVLIGELLPLVRGSLTEPQAATYCGLTPLSRLSGKGGKRSRLSPGVNKHLIRALYLSARTAASHNPIDKAFYAKQKRSHLGHPVPNIVATIALARQRMKVMYKLMTTSARYDLKRLTADHLERNGEVAA